MNKRYIAILASAALLLTLPVAMAACGGGSSSTTATPSRAGTVTARPSSSATPSASSTTSSSTVSAANNPTLGKNILVNAEGKTLYRYDKDTAGTSACTGSCATTWPPLIATAGSTPKAGSGVTGQLATITRADGTKQVTYNGAPLYTYQQDTKTGDASGDGVNSFHVATP